MLRGKYLCRSRGSIFRLHSYFGFHYSEFFPQRPRSYLCIMLDGFFLLFSVPELPASPHMLHISSSEIMCPYQLWWTFCVDHMLEMRRFLYFGLVTGFRNLFLLVTRTSQSIGRMDHPFKKNACLKNTRKLTFLMRIEW